MIILRDSLFSEKEEKPKKKRHIGRKILIGATALGGLGFGLARRGLLGGEAGVAANGVVNRVGNAIGGDLGTTMRDSADVGLARTIVRNPESFNLGKNVLEYFKDSANDANMWSKKRALDRNKAGLLIPGLGKALRPGELFESIVKLNDKINNKTSNRENNGDTIIGSPSVVIR